MTVCSGQLNMTEGTFAETRPYNGKMDSETTKSQSLPTYGQMGEEVKLEHLQAYVVKPDTATDQAVIVIHDVYGWQTPNIRYMTDMMCLAEYIAVCPDFFVGKKPWDPTAGQLFWDWQKDKKPDTVFKEVNLVLKYLKDECKAKHIAVVGFCWGGAAVYHITLQYPEIKAAVSFYGMAQHTEDNYELKCPTLFIFGERDRVILYQQVTLFKTKLQETCRVDFKVKTFPEQTHGFAHRLLKDIEDADKTNIKEARKDMFLWLKEYMVDSFEAELKETCTG